MPLECLRCWLGDPESYWYDPARRPPLNARGLAKLYGAAIALRRIGYRRGWLRAVRLPVPVVVVGNLSVGGTGKTPLVMALANALTERGFVPGIVSRGYGGWQREPALLPATPDPARYGDEPCLARAAGFPVAVARDRPAAASLLLDAGCNLVIADDGLQHYRLARDLELCVIDGERRFGNARLLPAGPLREPLSRLAELDARICHGGVAEPGEILMRLRDGLAQSLDGHRRRPWSAWQGREVHAVAGIGHPQRFFRSLRVLGLRPIEHPFPDHHAFTLEDLQFGDGLPVLLTSKDAVKCAGFTLADAWSVPVEAELPKAFWDELALRLCSLQYS